MKRNSLSFLNASIIIALIFSLTSCSYFSRRSQDFNDDKKLDQKKVSGTVSMEQYNALLARYNELKRKTEGQGQRVSQELINELAGSPKAELAETVNVFDEKRPVPKTSKSNIVINDPSMNLSDREVEGQLAKLKKAEDLLEANKFNEALSYIKKDIENSPVLQVRVKAKFLLGELLLRQNEYDLAMQIFEDIISNYAFSGLVIKTLGRLIHCSDKLKLNDKKEKYFSMLNDIFGTG